MDRVVTTEPNAHTPAEVDAQITQATALPRAPLAMPKQHLEREPGSLFRLLARIAAAGSTRTES